MVAALEISRVGFRSNKAGLEQLFYKIVAGILLSGLVGGGKKMGPAQVRAWGGHVDKLVLADLAIPSHL